MVFIFTLSGYGLAFEVVTELKPSEPVRDQPFQLIFKIKTDSKKDAYITFNSGHIDVQGKSRLGEMIRTTFVNGKLSTQREISYAYELYSTKSGFYRISDIRIEVDGKEKKLPGVNVKILDRAVKRAPIYLAVETDKEQYYVGEAIRVNYVLYNKYKVNGLDVVKFPKLSGFLKRFKNQSGRTQKVTRKGEIFERREIYSGTLFATKPGDVLLDSMTMRIQYLKGMGSNDPFGGFAFGFSRPQVMNVSNPGISISILPLPETGKPPGFTGLVGKHEIEYKVNKHKFLVNEAVEFKVSITGEGALENFELPEFYNHPSLESFESNSDFTALDGKRSTKTFDSTFLARGPLDIPAKSLKLRYFDPADETYKFTEFELPAIEVVGTL